MIRLGGDNVLGCWYVERAHGNDVINNQTTVIYIKSNSGKLVRGELQ